MNLLFGNFYLLLVLRLFAGDTYYALSICLSICVISGGVL
jgi:hypothetical protein